MPCATGKTWLRHAGRLPWWRQKGGNGASPLVALFATPIEPLKEGEVLEINPETGDRGVWRTIGGRSVFIAVKKGESVPKAIRRAQKEKEEKGQQERSTMVTRAAAELSPTYEPPVGSPLADPKIRKRAISSAEEMLSYSNIVALGLALRMRAQEMFTGQPMQRAIGIGDPETFVSLMERKFLPPGVKTTDLIRTMYAEMQQQLRKEGVTSMTLYRGTNNPAVEAPRRRKADPSVDVLVDMKGFSSWSRSQSEASRFGRSVMAAEVPAVMIWSIPSTFFEAPAFLMKSGLRIFEEEVILVPTRPLKATVGKAEKLGRRFAMANGELNVVLDDLTEAQRPDRKLEVWLLAQALRRMNPAIDRGTLKTWIREMLGGTSGSVLGEKTVALVMTPHGYLFSLTRHPTPFERKVDFAAIDSALKALTAQGRDRVRKLLEDARDKLLSLVANRHKAGRLTTKFVLDLELRGLGQLVPTLRETLGAAFRLGQREARKELRAGREAKASLAAQVRAVALAKPAWDRARLKAAFSNGNARGYQVKLVPEGLPPEKALEFFERKATLWATDVRQPLLGQVKNVLFNGIKTGAGLRDLMAGIEAAFQPWLGDEDMLVDGEDVTPYRLETLVRTNIGEAMNEGRKAQFQGAVDDGFVIGFQFSAILDERTTPVCSYLDGLIFRPDSSEADQLSPPRHFNCRSLWSPVLRTEGPVEYITPREIARGIELSGKGFEERQEARAVPVLGGNGKDREPEPVEETRLAVPDVAIHQAPIAVRVEGPHVMVPAQEAPKVEVGDA